MRTIYSINKSNPPGLIAPQWEQHKGIKYQLHCSSFPCPESTQLPVTELEASLNSWLDGVPEHRTCLEPAISLCGRPHIVLFSQMESSYGQRIYRTSSAPTRRVLLRTDHYSSANHPTLSIRQAGPPRIPPFSRNLRQRGSVLQYHPGQVHGHRSVAGARAVGVLFRLGTNDKYRRGP